MTFIEILPEIKRGRGFKRQSWNDYHYYKDCVNGEYLKIHEDFLTIDDFELEPITNKNISLMEFREAWNKFSVVDADKSDLFKKIRDRLF